MYSKSWHQRCWLLQTSAVHSGMLRINFMDKSWLAEIYSCFICAINWSPFFRFLPVHLLFENSPQVPDGSKNWSFLATGPPHVKPLRSYLCLVFRNLEFHIIPVEYLALKLQASWWFLGFPEVEWGAEHHWRWPVSGPSLLEPAPS